MPLLPADSSLLERPLIIFEVEVAHKPISTWWDNPA
jgi:hypothetical protein